MRQRISERAIHALISLMLSAGIVMPVLGVLDDSFLKPGVLLISAVIILVFEAASLHRIAAFSAAGGMLIGIIVWMFGAGGAQIVSDFMVAVTLRIRGIHTALPLIADQAMDITACLLTVLCCFACMRKMTCVPAAVLCTGAAALVWLSDRTDLIPWLLPALAAVLAMMMITRFRETSALRILPWAAGIAAAAYFIAGSGAVVEPLKDKADELRQAVMDRLFFVEARDVFSLYAVGFSPQGQNQLGGKPNPDDGVMMQVATSDVTYLRGAIYDRYDGHAWQNTAGGKRYLWQSDRMETEKAEIFNLDLPSDAVQNAQKETETITVRILNESASTLFVPQRIRDLTPGGDMVPYFTGSTEIFITRNLRPGDTYDTEALLYKATEYGMSQSLELCSAMDDSFWDNMPDMYLQLPDHMGEAVYELAREITKGANTPYERAMLIQNYLNRSFQYTLDVGEHPDNIDFVTTFLMETRKGYCTYFASAMTVLCRMAGLPARYVEGYIAEPNPQTHEALVTGMDAHAWTEVYFKGFGWLTFDATPKNRRTFEPDDSNPSGKGDEETPPPGKTTPEPEDEPTPTPEPENESTPTPDPDNEPTPTPDPDNEPTPTPEPEDEPSLSPEQPEDDAPTPTPDAENPPPENANTPTPEIPPEPSASPGEKHRQVPPGEPESSFPWIPLLILVLLAVTAGRVAVTSPSIRNRYARTEEKRFDIWVQEIHDLLTSEKLKRNADETPMGFTRRIDGEGFFTTILGPVGECASLIRYSAVQPLATDTQMVRNTAASLRKEMSRPARIRYWGRRMFLPRHKRDWTRMNR